MPVVKVEMNQSVGSAGWTEESKFARKSSMFFVLETMQSKRGAQVQEGPHTDLLSLHQAASLNASAPCQSLPLAPHTSFALCRSRLPPQLSRQTC